jgi:DNA repair ATPase RecN
MVMQEERLNVSTSLSTILHQVAESNHKRSLIIIFSDFFSNESLDELTDAFLHLKHNKHEVLLFNVMDKMTEMDFDFPNKPTTFIDLESGEKIKLHPAEVKKAFQEQVKKVTNDLKMKCAQFKIDFIETDIQEGIEFVLQQYLVKRQKLI